MKFKVIYVKDKLPQGYIGMNKPAYEEIYHKPYPYPKNIILILKGMGKAQTRRTITHEKHELIVMSKGLKYHKAHIMSNRVEDLRMPNG
jgi:hypothetical protein